MDIVGVNILSAGSVYTAQFRVVDSLPSRSSDQSSFEWGVLIDYDQDQNTHAWGQMPLIDNGIGADVLTRVLLRSTGYSGELLSWSAGRMLSQKINFRVDGGLVEIQFEASLVKNVNAFDFIFETRHYVSSNSWVIDKCPNEGYFTYSEGEITLVTGQTNVGQPFKSLQTNHSITYYNQGNEQKARQYGEAFENAYTQVGTDLGAYPARQFKLYVYSTQEDLVRGLQLYSGFSADSANYFRTGGAPRPINYVMHIAPSFDWHTITHEYTHTIIEELSGQVYRSIKWLDEGLADHEAYTTVAKTKYNQTEFQLKANTMRIVYDALDKGKLFSLRELSSETDWHNRLPGTPERTLQYAETAGRPQ
jgi:hypothetical protein